MTTSVDVLAALRQISDGEGDAQVLAMRVHSAVAELIEAAGKLRADVFLWRLTGNMPNLQMLANDEEALDAALARVKGA